MTNKKNCKRMCEHNPTLLSENVRVYSITAGSIRRMFFGMFKTCRECGKMFLRTDGLPYDKMFCFCCGAKMGVRPKNNMARKEYTAKRERLRMGAVPI